MLNDVAKFEKKYRDNIIKDKKIDSFSPGDTVVIKIRIFEGKNVRLQSFEGLVIGKKNGIMSDSFRVRKMSGDVEIERIFSVHSPLIESVTVVRKGVVRRAKLYYLRDRIGKSARIREKINNK